MIRIARFFGIQTIGTVADFAFAMALYAIFGVAGILASTLGFFLGTVINYLGHHHVTFRQDVPTPATVLGFLKYLAAVSMSLVVRVLILLGFEQWLSVPFWFALSVAFIGSFICSYLFSLLWVFRRNA